MASDSVVQSQGYERHQITLTASACVASGSTDVVTGRVLMIGYTKVDFPNGVTFAITTSSASVALWSQASVNASATIYPRVQVTGANTTGLVLNSDDDPMVDYIRCIHETVDIALTAAGSAATTGTFDIFTGP